MRKNILLVLTVLFSLSISAQSNWELPSSNTEVSTEKVKKEAKKKQKKEQKKELKDSLVTEVVDGKTYEVKAEDMPYLAGAVPEEDGKVVFTADISNSLSAEEAYERVYKLMDELSKEKYQTEGKSKVAIVDTQEHSVVGTYNEQLIFHKKALELDYTMFSYVIIAKCKDNDVNIRIERLSYDYTFGKEPEHLLAENLITDDKMLTNNGTKLRKINSKFRKRTVDRMRELIAAFREALQ